MESAWRAMTLVLRYGAAAHVVVGHDETVQWANRAARRLFTGTTLRGTQFSQLFDDAGTASLFLQSISRNRAGYAGAWRTVHRNPDGWLTELLIEAAPLPAGHLTGCVVTIYATPPEVADRDALTGCGNRLALSRDLRDLDAKGFLALLDLNEFKMLNDQYGHESGDQVLRAVTSSIADFLGDQGRVYRLAGDEFAVLFHVEDDIEAITRAEGIWRAVTQPIRVVAVGELSVGVAIGVVRVDHRHEAAVMREADQAMYYAKAHGLAVTVAWRDLPDWARDRRSVMTAAEELTAERDQLAILARTDALTQLPNRLALEGDAWALAQHSQQASQSFCALFIDLDHFSDYNHHHGDQAGDEALVTVAELMRRQCRSDDVVYRKGGEEFVVLLPNTTLKDAAQIGERVRLAIQDAAIPHEGRLDGVLVLTAVVGVAEARHDEPPEAVWSRASFPIMQLKRRKRAARNQVLVAQ